ncbi:MAG: hypothetical protein ICV64_01805 [Thermoleophilia bacterium]|nr:hypothetical protein [Thermoleophilia bacterium]
MLDFTEGWTWFAAGFGTTVLVALAAVLVVALARRAERSTGGRPVR